MSIGLGSVLRCEESPFHRWIVLSDPHRTDGEVLMVNLTTIREHTMDDECILAPSDYPEFVTRPTAVAFSKALSGRLERVVEAVRTGKFTEVEPLREPTLKKILTAARGSRQLALAKKRLLAG